jgi:hypothetical protein
MNDLFYEPHRRFDVAPSCLHVAFSAYFERALVRELAGRFDVPWGEASESLYQQSVSTLVAEASAQGLDAFTVVVTMLNGRQQFQEVLLDEIKRARSLQ